VGSTALVDRGPEPGGDWTILGISAIFELKMILYCLVVGNHKGNEDTMRILQKGYGATGK